MTLISTSPGIMIMVQGTDTMHQQTLSVGVDVRRNSHYALIATQLAIAGPWHLHGTPTSRVFTATSGGTGVS